jgi:ribosomal protein S18 acetylase RimI-like enzyme
MIGEALILLARPSDAADLAHLLARQLQEHGIRDDPGVLRRAVEAVLKDSNLGFLVIARRGSIPVGVAYVSLVWSMEHGGRSAWLEELYVAPECRSRGIGTSLLRKALERSEAIGCLATDLEVQEDHARAASLYEREGFIQLARSRWVRRRLKRERIRE